MKITLDEIIIKKGKEVSAKKGKRDFLRSINNPKVGNIALIAEVKLTSPSAGKLGEEKDLEKQVSLYEKGGADAISVVVNEKYFGGDLEFIRRVKNVVSLPVLAKDFVIDSYQLYEMKAYGADAILLIAKIVSLDELVHLVKTARELNMEPVVEVQNETELDSAVKTATNIIAVNSRDLTTFAVDIDKACKLIKTIPEKFISLGFSGVSDRNDVKKYEDAGASGVLVGTSLMQSRNPEELIKALKRL